MTNTKNHKNCPHCGNPVPHTTGPGTLHLITIALLLGSVIFLWTNGRNANTAVPQPAQPDAPDRKTSDILSYITSKNSDPSCTPCLSAASQYLEDLYKEALRKKTEQMVFMAKSDYQIGSPDNIGDPDENPRHAVELEPYYIDKHEVTIAEYMQFAKTNPANYPEWAKIDGKFNIDTGNNDYYRKLSPTLKNCETCPVVGVGYKDADAYCKWKGLRLPTEAEWEAAARGGTETAFHFGDSPALAPEYAWFEANSDGHPQPVSQKKPNQYGIYDMHGNVWEWVADNYSKDYYSKSPKKRPTGPETGSEKVIRGGSWAFDADSLRSANRASTTKPNDDIGFRCAANESDLKWQIDQESRPVLR